jgi:hypothetical protein
VLQEMNFTRVCLGTPRRPKAQLWLSNDLLFGPSLSRPASPSFSNPDSLDEELWAPRSGPASQPSGPVALEAPGPVEATPRPTPQVATLSEQGLHKRQSSEVISRERREK